MSDQDENGPTKGENPYAWITPEIYLEFMKGRGIPEHCELCDHGDSWWIDTGWDDGYVPRLAAMTQLPGGYANTADTIQMPVIRAMCVNCGNIRLHAMWVLQTWRELSERTGMKWGARGFTPETAQPDNE